MDTSYPKYVQYSVTIMHNAQYYSDLDQFNIFKVIVETNVLILNVHFFKKENEKDFIFLMQSVKNMSIPIFTCYSIIKEYKISKFLILVLKNKTK